MKILVFTDLHYFGEGVPEFDKNEIKLSIENVSL